MKCPYCAKEIKDTASFCGYCGKSVKEVFSAKLEDTVPPAVDLKPVPPIVAREKSYDASPQNFSIQNSLKQDGSNSDRSNRNEAPDYLSHPQHPKKKHGVLRVLLIIFMLAVIGGIGAVGFLIYNESIDISDINPMDLIDTLLENVIYRNRVGDKSTVDVIESDTDALAAGNETEDTETVKSSHNSEWIDLFRGIFISVDDQAEVWTDEMNRPFAESAKRIASHTDFSAIIVTTDDTDGMTNRDYAAEYFNQFPRVDQEHEQLFENCVLVLINVNSHDFYAVARGEATSVYNWDDFSDQLSAYLLSGDYETVVIELLEHRMNPTNETAEDEESDQTVSNLENNATLPITMEHIVKVSASSELAEYNMVHSATFLIDGSLEKAWVEGVRGQGIGESIDIIFDDEYLVSGFTIYAGYQKSIDLYQKNSRPASIGISFEDGSYSSYELGDIYGRQDIKLETPTKSSRITLFIESVYAGNKYEDTVITELALF